MSMRDIVTGSDMCTPSGDGGAGPSNAVGSLVNTLLGGGGKTQEQLRELPHVGPGGSMLGGPHGGLANSAAAAAAAASHANGFQISGMAGPSFAGPRGAMLAGMPGPMMGQQRMGGPGMMGAQQPHEWDSIFGGASASAGPSMQQPHIQMPHMAHDAPPDAVMRNVLQLFIGGGRAAAPFAAGPMPPGAVGGLSVVDKCRIRDRATILSRHIYADQGERFADQQVGSLLASLHINPAELPGELPHVHDQGWHDAWDHAQQHRGHMASEEVAAGAHQAGWEGVWGGQRGPGPMMQQQQRPMSTGWADEYAAHAGVRPPMLSGPAPWADEFATQQLWKSR
ncbi:hypothetical protein FOA52_015155 [Chlamydomonas sp. UWO 241]|nr:hypothetical protein FOA52_015155 [Chlamydomonas sp. UWO 241]